MSEKLSTIVGKENDFATRLMDGGSIATGVTGTILTLTPPSGQRVRLTHLSTTAGTSQSGVSVLFAAETVVSEDVIDGDVPSAGSVSVGSYQDYTAGAPTRGNYLFWTGGANEVLTIVKNAGNTSQTIYYGYQFGE